MLILYAHSLVKSALSADNRLSVFQAQTVIGARMDGCAWYLTSSKSS